MAVELSEQLVASLAPADKSMLDGRGLIKKGAFRSLSKSDDGTLLFGECKGSGQSPYKVSVDLDVADHPVVRCDCPSRQRPCKHGLGLMLAFLSKGGDFKTTTAPKDLLEKRQKYLERYGK